MNRAPPSGLPSDIARLDLLRSKAGRAPPPSAASATAPESSTSFRVHNNSPPPLKLAPPKVRPGARATRAQRELKTIATLWRRESARIKTVAALLLFLLAAPIHVAHAGNAPLGGGGSCSYGTEPDGTNTMVGVAATPLTGGYNTAIGDSALTRIYGGGQYNTALVYEALASDTTGNNNVAVGMQALQANSTTSGNTAVGFETLYSSTNSPNTAIGASALENTSTGSHNAALGYEAMQGVAATPLTGNYNTAVGYQAGYAGTAVTTGTNNTFLGYQAQANGAAYTNSTALGNGATITASNSIVFGNSSITVLYAFITTITGMFDRRTKKDIEDAVSSKNCVLSPTATTTATTHCATASSPRMSSRPCPNRFRKRAS